MVVACGSGYTGTLDPLATGVLPLCFGAATKFSQLHLDADKTYETTLRLGLTTSTGDAEGDITATQPVACSVGQVVEVLDHFTGVIQQLPPMYSALNDGKALYEYARAGMRSSARRARSRSAIGVAATVAPARPTRLGRVCGCCAARAPMSARWAEDIGAALGCGAHCLALRRTPHRRLWTGAWMSRWSRSRRCPQNLTLWALLLPVGRTAGRPHACHARRRQCRPLPERSCAAAAPGPMPHRWRSTVDRSRRLAGHRPRQAGEADAGALLLRPDRNATKSWRPHS